MSFQSERSRKKPAVPNGFISSQNALMPINVVAEHKTTARLIRGHWEIENSLHWSLDVVMNDDDHRARKDHVPENFAILRRIALNIIKGNPDKGSNRKKFQRAGWDNNFLTKLIQGF